ncbi:MAG: hypothetical protein AAFX06_30995, partial [Planctomycetota bacterium]
EPGRAIERLPLPDEFPHPRKHVDPPATKWMQLLQAASIWLQEGEEKASLHSPTPFRLRKPLSFSS